MRQVVLDTETTGLEPSQGHRIIEIGCVEMVNRKLTGRHYHQYIQPEREVEAGAMSVHGITNEFLADKPLFADIVDDFIAFIDGAELVIHNAPFDVGFMDHELKLLNYGRTTLDFCTVFDSLVLARNKHPGQRNNLDALCQRYGVDNTSRELHGALLDAEILADVFLEMTREQAGLALSDDVDGEAGGGVSRIRRLSTQRPPLRVITASAEELAAHEQQLDLADKKSDGQAVWRRAQRSDEAEAGVDGT